MIKHTKQENGLISWPVLYLEIRKRKVDEYNFVIVATGRIANLHLIDVQMYLQGVRVFFE